MASIGPGRRGSTRRRVAPPAVDREVRGPGGRSWASFGPPLFDLPAGYLATAPLHAAAFASVVSYLLTATTTAHLQTGSAGPGLAVSRVVVLATAHLALARAASSRPRFCDRSR